ncbi:MAG: hypothetical protein IPK32_07150 [Verrucomicrobiaceae bacterium]|nr:hypothetical protein [Verrucomicrobiaceae bacterium]
MHKAKATTPSRPKGLIRLFKPTKARESHVIAYHGTPQVENARSILRHGWMVSTGNAYGDGVYLAADLVTAQGYARGGGVIIKCRVRLSRCCQWDSSWQQRYDDWCRKRKVIADNSAKTAFLIQAGMRVLRAGSILVVLSPQYANATAWKLRRPEIKILSIHSSSDMKSINV